jgi:tRNA dimethylallyltransferase
MSNQRKKPVFCLMGPTASGKTPLAIELVQRYPFEIISVDSAMVYRGMDIGTAKPDGDELKKAPHRLINCCDPAEAYSAGQFRENALREIAAIHDAGKIPLLVGGTMLYFRVLMQGIANLPRANSEIRDRLTGRAAVEGTECLHAELKKIDPVAAAKIHCNDLQRISRALEVYELTGKPISTLQESDTSPLSGYDVTQVALMPASRAILHERIAARFEKMLAQGFIQEVQSLYQRGDLSLTLPSMRSVGYHEVWQYLAGQITEAQMKEKAIAATRQLAKRQITWLRTWPDCHYLDSEAGCLKEIFGFILMKNNISIRP